MKHFYLFLFLAASFLAPKITNAQGYIDCAIILNDEDYPDTYSGETIVKNGFVYLLVTLEQGDPPPFEYPVINGEGFHGAWERDGYLAIFDSNCNQLLGTFIGGTNAEEVYSLKVDAAGDMVVAGYTESDDFFTTDGTSTVLENESVFVRKYKPDGTLVFSTILGGTTGDDDDPRVVIDGTDIYVYGIAKSSDFPTTNGTSHSGGNDLFAAKYDGSGNLLYSTVYGGSSDETASQAVVVNGELFLTGRSFSTDFTPSTDGTVLNGNLSGYLMNLDANGNIICNSIIGGSGNDAGFSIYTDGADIYILGTTSSPDFVTTNGSTATGTDLYVRKYDSLCNLTYSVIHGGANLFETTRDIQVVNGLVYILATAQAGFPTVNGMPNSGGIDALLINLDANGEVLYATYYGGTSNDYQETFYVNPSGEVYLYMTTTNALTTDGTTAKGTTYAKFNADGSLCMASTLPNEGTSPGFFRQEVVGDTIWSVVVVDAGKGAASTDGSAADPSWYDELLLTKFVFCPTPQTITSDVLNPSTQTVCQNGLVDQIIGEEHVIDGSNFPQIYTDGIAGDQADIELAYQWQISATSTGPWTDINGPLATQKNYTPSPTTVDVYFRRQTVASECCGGGTALSTSDVSSIIVGPDAAPTVDAGGTFYTCPGSAVTIGGSPSATGTPSFTYDWNDGDFSIANPTVSPTESTIYTLEVMDGNGCIQADQATVTIYEANAGADTDVCDGNSTIIGGAALPGVTIVSGGGTPPAGQFSINYDWTPNDGSLSCVDCPNPSATPSSNTDYTLTATINYPDGSFCQTTDDVSVNLVASPSGQMTIPDTVVCLGDVIDLGFNTPPLNTSIIATVVDDEATTYPAADFSDGDLSTGVLRPSGTSYFVDIDLGQIDQVNSVNLTSMTGAYLWRQNLLYSTDGTNWTLLYYHPAFNTSYSHSFPTISVRYFRIQASVTSFYCKANAAEFSAKLDYDYIWTPGSNITTTGVNATFDPGNIDMPGSNPVTYTASATLGTCTFYNQVKVAVIEARAGVDACGPRVLGEEDRTPNIDETYTWVKITDPAWTTGTGDIVGANNIVHPTVSASVGGNVAYELTVSYEMSGSIGICRDTVVVPPTCDVNCNIAVIDDGCPDFDEGSVGLMAVPQDGNEANWTYSWTSNLGMAGLDSYTTAEVNLVDNVTRTYTVTMTNILDPSFTCDASIEVNSPAFSTPSFNPSAVEVTTCGGVGVNIGDPANNPGLTYEWSNPSNLDNPAISYPEATVDINTEFTVTVTDNVTGCKVVDTINVIVPDIANAGPDLTVCDNGIVTIGENTPIAGYTYSWSPVGADWRNGTGPTDANPEVFVAIATQFTLTVTDPTGTCVSNDIMDVNVDALPVSFTMPDINFCPSQTGALVLGHDDGTTGGNNLVPSGYLYSWSPAYLLNDATVQNPTLATPLPSSSFTFEVEVRTAGGCNQIATQTINPTVAQPIVVANKSICLSESTSIGDDANPTGPDISYSWSPSTDLNDPTSPNPIFSPSATGSFTFTVTMSDNSTTPACNSTNEVTVDVSEVTNAPTLSPQVICEGNTVEIGVETDFSLSYDWSPATDLDDATIANPTFNGTASTNYTLTVINGLGCTAEVSTSVTVNPPPAITAIDYPDQEFCDPSTPSTVLEGNILPAGSYAYSWSPIAFLDNPNAANPTLFLAGEGTYEYELEIIDQATGCSVFKTVKVTVGEGCFNAVIGNYVWLDENGDGVQDAGEPGIAGVVVELKDGAGNVVATTTTDANGGYIFTELPAGNYTVTVLSGLPTGAVPTYDEDSGTTSPDAATSVTVANGDEHMTADFGYNYTPPADTDAPVMAATGALGDQIWNDANGDGLMNPGESGIAGVTVNLFSDPDGDGVYDTPAGTTTTDASGNYIFDGLVPAAYVVEVDDTTLAGFTTTPTGDPDSDADNISEPIIVAPGDVVLTGDFGYQPTVGFTIGDLIFVDANGDGTQDAGEPGIAGVTVSLEDAAGNVIATTTTDANGNYSFPGLADATTYTIVITDTDNVLGGMDVISDPNGGTALTSSVTIAAGDDLDQDFGFAPNGHTGTDGLIGNTVYIDTNADAMLTADEGVEGVTVELYAADGTTLVATTTTDENGNYLFGGLDPAATYVVKVDETTLPGGDVYTNMEDPDAGATGESTVDLSATAGVNLDQDFGYEATAPVMISGTIWEDTDADGEFALDAATETTMFEGVTVVLTDANGNIVATTTTDVNGDYSFDNIPADSYTVSVEDVDDVLLGYWHSLGNESEPSTTTVDASGGSVADVDFGYYIDGASIGNFVWNDADGDGIQDAGEAGIAAVAVTLEIDYNGDGIPDITVVDTTDANGYYSFDNLLLDEDYASSGTVDYTISAVAPTGYEATIIDVSANGNDLADSDDPTGIVATVTQGVNNTTTNADPTMESPEASYDFGFIQTGTATIGNIVWLDENGDGVQDGGESGIAGVVVELKNSNGVVIATTTTDANGGYIFTDLPADTYTVTVLSGLPTGALATYDENSGTASPDAITTVTIADGDEHMTADFGYNYVSSADTDSPVTGTTGALGDRIWNDANSDGVQDPGESGIAGVTVNLFTDPDGDGVYDTPAGTTITDANGNYIFDGLAPDAYVVEVDDASLVGYTTVPTGDPDGDADNTSDPIVVAPGDVVLIGNFGYPPTAGSTISNLVYIDADGDGTQDAGEPGIPGVTVVLEDAAGNVIATTTTDENGNYSFPGLADGSYTVVINDTDNVLGELDIISDPNGGTSLSSTVAIMGADNAEQDFGFAPSDHVTGDGLIGNTVFIDTDASNSLTPGEGVEGVTVELFAANGTTLLQTVVTDENGEYYFGGLDATATYVVKVDESTLPGGDIYVNNVDPDGGTPGSGESTSDLSLTSNGVDLTRDFGYQANTPHTVSGTVWEDDNADGTYQAAEMNEFSGVTVDLLDAAGNILSTTVTDVDGNYSFANIPDGDYTILVTDVDDVLAPTWHSIGSDSEPEAVTVNVNGADVPDVDFGYYSETASLGNRVWEDADGNGIQDNGETGMANVVVTLTIDYGNGNVITVTTITDGSGYYSFDNLLLDEDYNGDGMGTEPIYTISAALPAGYVNTSLNATNDSADADDPSGVLAVPTQGIVENAILADPTAELSIASYDFGFMAEPLAVELLSFNGRVVDCDVQLNWTTGEQDNFSHFELEHSTEGQMFKRINRTTSNEFEGRINSYEFVDKNSIASNYYRLKMIDFDGTTSYSEVIYLRKDCESVSGVNIYPNPISVDQGELTLEFKSNEKEVQIDIYDAIGRKVFNMHQSVNKDWNKISLNVRQLPAGSYFLHIGGNNEAQRFIVIE